jgi:hypothetical protein
VAKQADAGSAAGRTRTGSGSPIEMRCCASAEGPSASARLDTIHATTLPWALFIGEMSVSSHVSPEPKRRRPVKTRTTPSALALAGCSADGGSTIGWTMKARETAPRLFVLAAC